MAQISKSIVYCVVTSTDSNCNIALLCIAYKNDAENCHGGQSRDKVENLSSLLDAFQIFCLLFHVNVYKLFRFLLSLLRHSVKLLCLYISSIYWFSCVIGLVSWGLIFYLDWKLAVSMILDFLPWLRMFLFAISDI